MAFPQLNDPFTHTNDPLSDHADWDALSSGTDIPRSDGSDLVWPNGDPFEGSIGTFQTATNGISQCVLMKMSSIDSAGSFGSMLRQANADGTGACLWLNLRYSGSAWQFNVERYTGITFEENINSRTNLASVPTANDYIGFAVTGTGNGNGDTSFEYWDFGASDPGEFSTWGASTEEDTDAHTTAVDTGNYVGVSMYYAGANSSDHNCTQWWGGDQAAAAAAGAITLRNPLRMFQGNLVR